MSQLPWEHPNVSMMMQIFNGRVTSVVPISTLPVIGKQQEDTYNDADESLS